MAKKNNFLLGHGERLTQQITRPGGGGPKADPYSLEESINALIPMVAAATEAFEGLPTMACPQDEAVGIITLHPTYVARSYFPDSLLNTLGLRSVGSRPKDITPRKWTKQKAPKSSKTVDIFVSGKRQCFYNFLSLLKTGDPNLIPVEIIKIEEFRSFYPGERLKNLTIEDSEQKIKLEVAIHTPNTINTDYILLGFEEYLNHLGAKPDFERRIHTNGLCFLPVWAPKNCLSEMDQFSYLRIARKMPELRSLSPSFRIADSAQPFKCEIPTNIKAVDPNLKMAIFDGGISPVHKGLDPWVKKYAWRDQGAPFDEGLIHGFAVTSSALFGPLEEGIPLKQPYANVDHYRVLDQGSDGDGDLFDVLNRILGILQTRKHQFVNLSIGPAIPIEDAEVEVWTAALDEQFSDGKTFTTIAVGNDGDKDKASGIARIQVPSDCVNAMGIGACDSLSASHWKRAGYSSIGPGRSPGIVKPDVVAFGGSRDEPYYVVDPKEPCQAIPVCGTSFAAPSVLRLAAGIRAHFREQLSTLTIRALLIHHSHNLSHPKNEVGWGRIPDSIDDIVLCADDSVTVTYQGELVPGKYIRAQIPAPSSMEGMVNIKATLCFASEVDQQDVASYTKSGLKVAFRPHEDKFTDEKSVNPKTNTFFSQSKMYQTEQELRDDAHKWETVLHGQVKKRGGSLKGPVFDIEYTARSGGGSPKYPLNIPYALVVTVQAPRETNLYDQVVNRYRTLLEAIQPVVEIPIQT